MVDGRVYYWNVYTGQSQWQPPDLVSGDEEEDDEYEEEDEEDNVLDEMDVTQSRFSCWVPAHAYVPVVPFRELPAGMEVYVSLTRSGSCFNGYVYFFICLF